MRRMELSKLLVSLDKLLINLDSLQIACVYMRVWADNVISNGNSTECSRSAIIRVITKSNNRAAGV